MTDPLTLVTEADLQQTIEELLDLYGYLQFHDRDSRRNRAGLPDIIACRPPVPGGPQAPDRSGTGGPRPPGILYLLELKTQHGRLRPGQLAWGSALAACREVRYEIVRPADLPRLVHELR